VEQVDGAGVKFNVKERVVHTTRLGERALKVWGSSSSVPTDVVAQGGQPARHGTLGVTLPRHSAPPHCVPDDAAGTSGPGHAEPPRGAAALRPKPRVAYRMGRAQALGGRTRTLRYGQGRGWGAGTNWGHGRRTGPHGAARRD
jgi:hypothetical protein